MGEVTKDGYRMLDGTVIKFTDKLENISPRHSQELSEQNINSWDGFLIQRSIVCLENKILPAIESIRTHTAGCPINKNGIKNIVIEQIKIFGKKRYDNLLSKVRDLSVILTMVVALIAIIKNFI